MENAQNTDTTNNNQEPVIENEAIRNSEEVNLDKKNKQPNQDEDLPGYPHYSPNEDLLNPSNNMERVDIDVENITRAGNVSVKDLNAGPSGTPISDMEESAETGEEDDLEIVPGTEADVTKEDLLLLGSEDRDMDLGEDEELQDKGFPLAMTGKDLDVPGEELDDEQEDIGEEDEENNYYNLGGDNHANLEDPA